MKEVDASNTDTVSFLVLIRSDIVNHSREKRFEKARGREDNLYLRLRGYKEDVGRSKDLDRSQEMKTNLSRSI